ncbi:3-hydroxyisobutyrate dehydrogenase [Rhodococcoides kyotonense]|uniref:3-hydroxyisobutyrate dehydrogenase n=2 Tax=Rhodococcoides kyotonense TaxID=398843 RepID=A0A239M1U1_9NOCA|nr:3-hydroxyisobutyrate dehydrogenase [Rhodococcus kyotonensis]
MARRIVESGFTLTLWARSASTLAQYADTSAAYALTPTELGRVSDLVCICVTDDAGVEEVVTGEAGVLAGMAPGGAIAIHSTVHPKTCNRLAAACAEVGVDLIDAPVSGGGIAAAEKRLLVMTGGEYKVVDRFRPILETYANPIAHMGSLGAGQVTKLLNNTVFAAQLSTAAGILAIGRSLGLDPHRLADVMANGTAGSFALKVVGPSGGDLAGMSESVGVLLRKDVGILAEVVAAGADESAGHTVWAAADDALRLLKHPRDVATSRKGVSAS